MPEPTEEIEIKATTVATRTFRVDRAEYEQALADDELDYLFDSYVSDMDEETTYTTPDGRVHEYPSGEVIAEDHVIEVRETGWTIMHPLACRPNLFACEVNRAAERDLTEAPAVLGRFRCDAATGRFAIGAAVGGSDA